MSVKKIHKTDDELDLERYRREYAKSGDSFFAKGIEYMENGKVREGYSSYAENRKELHENRSELWYELMDKANAYIHTLMELGYTQAEIPDLLDLPVGHGTVNKISYKSTEVGMNSIKQVIKSFNQWIKGALIGSTDDKKKAEAS